MSRSWSGVGTTPRSIHDRYPRFVQPIRRSASRWEMPAASRRAFHVFGVGCVMWNLYALLRVLSRVARDCDETSHFDAWESPKSREKSHTVAGMRRDEQRGRVGRWLRAQRLERGYGTQAAAVKALGTWGWPVAASVYAEWESGGRVPSDENLARLQEFFGGSVAQSHQDADIAALIAINHELVTAVSALVARLDRLTDEQAGGLRDLAEAIGDLARQASRASEPDGSLDGARQPDQPRHRTQKKRPAGGSRPAWDEHPQTRSRSA